MNRQRRWALLLCLLSGCSTHPLVDFCDFFKPGRLGPTTVREGPYGGVAIPQGPIVPVAPNISVGPPSPLGPGGIVPPPAPLPGNIPPPLPPDPPPPPR